MTSTAKNDRKAWKDAKIFGRVFELNLENQNERMKETEEEEVEDWVTEQQRPEDECYRELTPKEDAWWARHVQQIEEILRNQARQREIHGITCGHPNSVQHVMKISSCVEALM